MITKFQNVKKLIKKPFKRVPSIDVIDQIDVRPLVDDLSSIGVDVDLLEDRRSDPRFEQKPSAEIDAANLAVVASGDGSSNG